MKVILIGAGGTIGRFVKQTLEADKIEVVSVGKTSGDYQVDIADPQGLAVLYQKIGSFDAVVNASGHVAFAPFPSMSAAKWSLGLQSKLMGQVHVVQQALPFINEGGSFTLVSGILSDIPIAGGSSAAMVNRAIEGFVMAAATELPKRLRINVVSPGLLTESLDKYGAAFPGFGTVDGAVVAQAFKRSVLGVQTGQVFKVV